jgi:hypothetical protein
MTLEFLSNVEADTSVEWRLRDGRIRTKHGVCPICWLATKLKVNPMGLTLSWRHVVNGFGLSFSAGELIAASADDILEDQKIRTKLLRACRLQEVIQ